MAKKLVVMQGMFVEALFADGSQEKLSLRFNETNIDFATVPSPQMRLAVLTMLAVAGPVLTGVYRVRLSFVQKKAMSHLAIEVLRADEEWRALEVTIPWQSLTPVK